MKNVNLMPKPVQKPYPPIWIAAMAEKSVARVARMGYHLAGSGGIDLQQMYDSGLAMPVMTWRVITSLIAGGLRGRDAGSGVGRRRAASVLHDDRIRPPL